MPFDKSTLTELIDEMHSEIVASLKDADPELRDSIISIISKAVAGTLNGLYSYLEYMSKQMFPDTADAEYSGRWGSIKQIAPLTAQYSNGSVTITGSEGSGVSLGDQLRRGDGTLFETTASVVIPASGTIDVAVQAVEPGTAGNSTAGTLLTFVSVPAGVASSATVVSMTGGTEDETPSEYAQRVTASFALPARGGANHDYETWAKEATDVTDVWVYGWHPSTNPHNILLGDVKVYFMMYDTYADGLPEAGDVAQVQAYIDERRPEGMGEATVAAPVLEEVDMEISISPDTTDNRDEVTSQITDMLRRKASPNSLIRQSDFFEAIGRAKDVDYFTIVSPAGTITPAASENIFTLGTITWS